MTSTPPSLPERKKKVPVYRYYPVTAPEPETPVPRGSTRSKTRANASAPASNDGASSQAPGRDLAKEKGRFAHDGTVCGNCDTTDTKYWCDLGTPRLLCHLCGPYELSHGIIRPLPGDRIEIQLPDDQKCANCDRGIDSTIQWRAGPGTSILCDQCGLYLQNRGAMKPIFRPRTAPEELPPPAVSLFTAPPTSDAATATSLSGAGIDNRVSGWTPINAPHVPSPLSQITSASSSSSSLWQEFENDPGDLITAAELPRLIHHLDRTLHDLGEDWEMAEVWNTLKVKLDRGMSISPIAAGAPLAARLPHPQNLRRYTTLRTPRPHGISRHPFRLRLLAEELLSCRPLIARCRFHQQHNFDWNSEAGRAALHIPGQPGVPTLEAANAMGIKDYDPSPFLLGEESEVLPDLMP